MANKKKYEVNGVQLPAAFNTSVLMRVFKDPSDMEKFYESYKAARFASGRAVIEPTEYDHKLAAEYKVSKNFAAVAKKLGVSWDEVASSVSRVARWKFLND